MAEDNIKRCQKCGAGPLGNCGYHGCETPHSTCPLAPPPQTNLRVTQAADAYVAEQGIEHSGGIIERAFEAGALWSMERAKAVRWRVFEATTPGYWGIELEGAGNDDDAILYPQKIHRDTVARIVEAHNAALSSEGKQ